MISRRQLLGGSAGLFAASWAGAGCSRERAAERPWPRTNTYEGVEMIELFPGDADERAPLVVAVHGMGDRPERWVEDWRTLPARAHVVLPRAFSPHGDGFSWFRFDPAMDDAAFGDEVGRAEERLWRGIAKIAAGRRAVVTGFSQGGILSFAMAARRADALVAAFPVAGSCPGPLLPARGAPSAKIRAFHGTADRILDVKWGRATVAAFKDRGADADLREYDGVGHTISPAMRADLREALVGALAG